jgi:hypothetical protein
MTTPTNKQRKRECMACGHEWISPVVYTQYTQNLSGEARVYCLECSSPAVVSYPQEDASVNHQTQGGPSARCGEG